MPATAYFRRPFFAYPGIFNTPMKTMFVDYIHKQNKGTISP